MKNPLIIAACVLVIAVQSCKKDEAEIDQTPPPVAVPLDTFKLTVSDTLYDPEFVTVTHIGGEIMAATQFNNYTNFSISMNDEIEPYTYSLNASAPFQLRFTNDNNTSVYSSTSGSVTIKSHNLELKTITGTFYATLTSPGSPEHKMVQGGEFNLVYE